MSIYVGNLPHQITPGDLTKFFAEYGPVKSVYLPKDKTQGRLRGFAFVERQTDIEEAAVINALDGADFMERSLKVSIARPRKQSSPAKTYSLKQKKAVDKKVTVNSH